MSYIDAPQRSYGRLSWEDFTFMRLCWLYGPERAVAIIRGEDAAMNEDVRAWRRFGR